jgi:hypothetical protein
MRRKDPKALQRHALRTSFAKHTSTLPATYPLRLKFEASPRRSCVAASAGQLMRARLARKVENIVRQMLRKIG